MPAPSNAADVAFQARVNDGQRASAAGGTIETVARTNDVAPRVSPAAQFNAFIAPSMSPGGKVAFRAKLRLLTGSRTPHEGIFLLE